MPSSKDEHGKPRTSKVLRSVVPLNDPDDADDEDYPPCDYCDPPPDGRRRLRFADEEGSPLSTTLRTQPSTSYREEIEITPIIRKTAAPATAAAAASLSDCGCPPPAARRSSSPARVARTSSSCTCGPSASKSATDVQCLYPSSSSSRSKSPICAMHARHICSLASASKAPSEEQGFSMVSMEGPAEARAAKGPCRRSTAEELVERRQPSWWEPALSRVLSVLVSTVLLLATGGAQPSQEHLAWTTDFLRCVKDRAGNSPPNVAALLQYLEALDADGQRRPSRASGGSQ